MPYGSYQPGIQPGFLKGPYGLAWGTAFGSVKDFWADKIKQGIQQRFPNLAQADALSRIGAERGIPQGASESLATYVGNLINAWNAWELGGTPWSILAQLNFLGYTGVYLVSQNGNVYGPSSTVVLPNPTLGIIGVPPAIATGGPMWSFAIGSNAFGSQGLSYSPALGGFTFKNYWEPSTVYPANSTVQPNPPNGFYYKSSGGGTSGSSAPAWPVIAGQTVSDGSVTWTCVGTIEGAPVGQSQGNVLTNYWGAYILIFVTIPGTWTNIQNPPTASSSPSIYEINTISALIQSFNAGHAQCCGFLVPNSGTRATFGWPQGRTFYGDAGLTTASADGLTTLWAPHTLVVLNAQRVPTSPNGYWYKATTGGTTGYSQPTWPTTVGNTVTDGTVIWTCEGTTNTFTTGTTPLATTFQFSPTLVEE